jgi:hypothetical protein
MHRDAALNPIILRREGDRSLGAVIARRFFVETPRPPEVHKGPAHLKVLSPGPSATAWLRLLPITVILPEIVDTHNARRDHLWLRSVKLLPSIVRSTLVIEFSVIAEDQQGLQ